MKRERQGEAIEIKTTGSRGKLGKDDFNSGYAEQVSV